MRRPAPSLAGMGTRLVEAMEQVHGGDLPAAVGNWLSSMARAFCGVMDAATTQQRLAAGERLLKDLDDDGAD